jgi:hypothetical protein
VARGGKRPGAGRPKGSKGKKTLARGDVARKALAQGVTPLDVLLEAMRDAYEVGGAMAAAVYAKEAAPYVHPKLSSIEGSLDGTIGHYVAQLIPVETRQSDCLVSAFPGPTDSSKH